MKTYSESKKRKSFNWYKFLSKKNYTVKEQVDIRRLSAGWVTCAVGNMCSIIPRESQPNDGMPIDKQLTNLGQRFHDSICSMTKQAYEYDLFATTIVGAQDYRFNDRSRRAALSTLNKIEIRSAQLIVLEVRKMISKAKDAGITLVIKR